MAPERRWAATFALSAKTGTTDLKMEMVCVRGIVRWRQNRAEASASLVARGAQKRAIGRIGTPIVLNHDGCAVLQAKARDIDRMGCGVGTKARVSPVIDVSAGVGSVVLDTRNAHDQIFLRQRFCLRE